MKGFHIFCQWPRAMWIKHWFYRKFSGCGRAERWFTRALEQTESVGGMRRWAWREPSAVYGIKKRAIRRGRGQSCSIFPVMFVPGGSVRLQQKHFLSRLLTFQQNCSCIFGCVGLRNSCLKAFIRKPTSSLFALICKAQDAENSTENNLTYLITLRNS